MAYDSFSGALARGLELHQDALSLRRQECMPCRLSASMLHGGGVRLTVAAATFACRQYARGIGGVLADDMGLGAALVLPL